jgi:hypothetical protein
MSSKPVANWSDDEVAIWLHCIGLGDKIDNFKENQVDGGLLLTLEKEDLTGDLGLTSLMAKKLLRERELLTSTSGGGGGGGDAQELQHLQVDNRHLEEEIKEKDAKIQKLEKEIAALKPPPQAPAPAPAPAPKAAPPPKQGAPVVKGAAKGAAGGAVKGAIGKRFAIIVLNMRCPTSTSDQIVFFL